MPIDLSTVNPKFLACLPASERPGAVNEPSDGKGGVSREIKELHHPIIKWCASQVPAVPCIYADSTKRSNMTEGVPDFTIFYRGKPLLIECKTRLGKLSDKQRDFKFLCEKQGITVHIVRTMEQFYALVL